MKALALDLGASGGKIFLGTFDRGLISVQEIHRFHNQAILVDGHLCWDFNMILDNLILGIRKAAQYNFTSLGVDSFCNDYGLLDQAGKLLSPIFSYRDARTEGILEKVELIMPARELYHITGCQQARFNTLVQLAAHKDSEDRQSLDKAHSFLFLSDLLNYHLCGVKVAEYTTASVSQLFNRKKNAWDSEIIRNFDLRQDLFPQVVPPAHLLGQAKREILELTNSKPFSIVTTGHHDTASAVAAVPATSSPFAYISSGTWSLLGTETDRMITSDESFALNFANEGGLGGRNRYLKNIMGLWLIQECKRQMESQGIYLSYAELDDEANQVSPMRSIIDPNSDIFFAPGDMIGRIQQQCRSTNQPVPETPGEINRCIKESLAMCYRQTLEQLEQTTDFSIPAVHIIGGGMNSQLLNQFASSAMGRDVVAGPIEAAAIGNLCAQFITAGEIRDLGEAREIIHKSFKIDVYEPESQSFWEDGYQRFVRNSVSTTTN